MKGAYSLVGGRGRAFEEVERGEQSGHQREQCSQQRDHKCKGPEAGAEWPCRRSWRRVGLEWGAERGGAGRVREGGRG